MKELGLVVDDADDEMNPADREEVIQRVRDLGLTSCDFCGDGCCDPDCYRCYSPLRPENLRTLAENLATAALLCYSWQLRATCPTWKPGCGKLPVRLPALMREAIASPHIGAFLRIPADKLHALGEIDDDGHRDPYFRRYRYVCRCGKTGIWRDGVVQARGDHDIHRSDMRESS